MLRHDVIALESITVPGVVIVVGPVYGVRVVPAGTPVLVRSGQFPAGGGVVVGGGVVGGTVVAVEVGVVVGLAVGVSSARIRPSRLAAFDSNAMMRVCLQESVFAVQGGVYGTGGATAYATPPTTKAMAATSRTTIRALRMFGTVLRGHSETLKVRYVPQLERPIVDQYLKFIQYVVLAVLGGTGASVLITGDFTDQTVLIGLVITGLTAAATFLKANTPTQPWAKQAVAIFGAAVLAVVAAWTDKSISSVEVIQILPAALAAWQVGTVANNRVRVTG